MAARSRRKGAAGEREVAEAMRAVYPDAKRGLAQPRSSKECPDIISTPWWVEVKRSQRPSVYAAIEQAREATDGRPLLIVTTRDREEPYATISLATLIALLVRTGGAV